MCNLRGEKLLRNELHLLIPGRRREREKEGDIKKKKKNVRNENLSLK